MVQKWRRKQEEIKRYAANPSRTQKGTVIQSSEKERFFKINDPWY